MKTLAAVLCSLLAASAVYAQAAKNVSDDAVCRLTVAQAPAPRDIRLGMSAEELLALFPGSSENDEIAAQLKGAEKPPRYGHITLGFDLSRYPTATQFAGVNNISVGLFDNQVISLWVHYSPMPGAVEPWTHVDEFIGKVAKAYKLPGAVAWAPPESAERKTLQCVGFTVAAATQSKCCPSLEVMVPFPRAQVEVRRRADQQKAREAFTP